MKSWQEVMATHLSAEKREILAASCVGIAGAGGLGSNCALMLARSGIGKLVIADFDTVSLSNLNRQQFLPEQIGLPKVEALISVLTRVNPFLQTVGHRVRLEPENLEEIFKACDLVIEAVDKAETKKMLLENFISLGKFVISASGLAGWGKEGMRIRRIGKKAVIVGDETSALAPHRPALSPGVTMAAAMQADQALYYLLGEGD